MAEKKIVELKQTAERVVEILNQVDDTYEATRNNAQDAKNTATSLQGTVSDLTNLVGTLGSDIETQKSDIATLKNIAAEYSLTYADDLLSLIKEKDGVSEVVGSPIKIVSASESVSSVITVTRVTPASNTVTLSEPGVIEYKVESLQDGVETGDINVTWKVNNVTVLVETVKQGTNTFKLDGRVFAGNNGVTATFVDNIGTSYTARWSVDVIDMYITSTFNDKVVYNGNASVSFTPFGALKKTIFFLLDGEEIYQTDITTSGVQSSYIVPHQEHGAHSLEIFCKATMNNGREIESTHLYYDIMFIDEGDNTPIIRWPYSGEPLTQFTATTFKYTAYTPNSLTTDIELYVAGEKVSSLTVDRNEKEWVYKPQATGENIVFTIKAGDVEKTKVLDVAAFPYDVNPVDGYTIDFNPTGRTNNDSDFDVWEYKDEEGNVLYNMSVSEGFDWNNGGWRVDEKGDSYFCVKAGSRMSINYPLFEPTEDTKLKGKNFKFIFKTTNNRAIADTVISCMASKEIEGKITSIGVDVGTQLAVLHMGTKSIDVQYVEDQKLELEFNIQEQTNEELDNRKSLVTLLINADPSKATLYDSNASFNLSDFAQNVPVTFGSDTCDVHLYRFKCYEQELSDKAIMQNYIADATNSDDMITRYEGNDILDESGEELDYNKLSKLCPDLRIILLTCKRFTFDKKDKVKGCTVQHMMGNGDPKHNWIAENVQIKGQGTSSNEYGTSGRNLDFKLNKIKIGDVEQDYALTFDDGTTAAKYAMTSPDPENGIAGSVPVNYFNLKVNIASSENANNARLAERFFQFNPYVRQARVDDPRVRDTMEFHPCVVFIKELGTDTEYGNQEFPADGKFHFYACGDFGNSKKNHAAFGMDTKAYDNFIDAAGKQATATPVDADGNEMPLPNEAIIEISNNTSPGCLFKFTPGWGNDILPDVDPAPTWDETKQKWNYVDIWGGDVVEHRYPEDLFDIVDSSGERAKEDDGSIIEPDDNKFNAAVRIFNNLKNNARRLWNWVASTDTTTVKETPDSLESLGIPEEKRYGFTEDNAAYRKEKFKREYMEYFEPKSLLYNYLFTDRYLMVDNRAKNVFIHTVDGKIWDLCFDYDNDTSLGCDNVGGLKFEYYYEDTDEINGEKVFNASTSVLWCNVRDCLGDELVSQYNAGSWATAKGLTDDFTAYQNIKPERLHMFDMRRKYIRPYTEGHYGSNIKDGKVNSYTRYLSMLNGRKTYQREAFEKYREAYINSKYQKASDSEAFIFRSVTKQAEQPMTLTPYCWLYVQVNFDGAKTPAVKTPAGQPVTLRVPAAQGLLEDKNVRIYHPRWLSGVDGLDQFYIREANFDYGIKLSKLVLGSDAEGYKNEKSEISLSIGGATLLEELNICGWESPKAWSINLSKNTGLKRFYATNTNMSSVDFASGGLLEEAKINAVSALSTINLKNLHTFELESLANITKARIENTALTTAVGFISQCTNLSRARIIGVDWLLPNNDLLHKLLAMSGIDENGFDTNQSVLAGKVEVPEIRQSEIDAYSTVWPNLEVVYDPGNLIPQYDIVFQDWDGTILGSTKVDLNGYVQDPVESGVIPAIPTKEPTISTRYTFSHWEGADMSIPVTGHRTYVATYSEETRMYTVSWYKNQTDDTPLKTVEVEYGSDVSMTDMSKLGPQYNASFNSYNLFKGWDKSTSYVEENLNVYAQWENGWVDTSGELVTTNLTAAQVYTLVQNDAIQGVFTDDGVTPQGDRIKVTMGNRFDFINANKEVLLSEPTYFDGTKCIDTGIALFEQDTDWTLVVDGQFNEGNSDQATLLSCYRSQDSAGLLFQYRNTTSGPAMVWGRTTAGISGWGTKREVYVIRHKAGDTGVTIFTGDLANLTPKKEEVARNASTKHPITLTLGAVKSATGAYSNYGIGTLHNVTLYHKYLGDSDCMAMAM